MIIFDLREEAQFASYFYLMGFFALTFAAAALAPRGLRRRLPEAVADSARPLAMIFILLTTVLAWLGYDERRQVDALVEQCLAGGCTQIEGAVHGVEPVHQVTSGSRYTAPMQSGYFWIGDTLISHSPRDHSGYSPANRLRDGDRVRVYRLDEVLVLVERVD